MHEQSKDEEDDAAACKQDIDKDITRAPKLMALYCLGFFRPFGVAFTHSILLQIGLLVRLAARYKMSTLEKLLQSTHFGLLTVKMMTVYCVRWGTQALCTMLILNLQPYAVPLECKSTGIGILANASWIHGIVTCIPFKN
jgi:hypothetical protein